MFGQGKEKYASVAIQGALLGTNLIYIERGQIDIPVLISTILILSLFVVQAFHPRLYYMFPWNGFIYKSTLYYDTYALYATLLISLFFTTWGIIGNWLLAAISASFIAVCGFLASYKLRPWIKSQLVSRERAKTHKIPIVCPKCQGEALSLRRIVTDQLGIEVLFCPECGEMGEIEMKPINLG